MIIHIGLPRTGTMTLRLRLFPWHSGIDYLGRRNGIAEVDDVVDTQILSQETLQFDAPKAKRQLENVVARRQSDGRVPLIATPGFTTGNQDRGIIAERLAYVCEGARIILVIRRQQDLLASWYFHTLERSGISESFEEWFRRGVSGSSPFVGGRHCFLYPLATKYAALFGKDNVKVLVFEQLVSDQRAFLEQLCSFMGIDPQEAIELCAGHHDNVRPTDVTVRFKALSARFPSARVARSLVPLTVRRFIRSRSRPAKVETVPSAMESWIQDVHAEDNRRLMTEWGLPLDDYGYVVD